MKKLKLNLQQFEGAEVLTRSQLKKVLGGGGGDGTGSGGGDGTCTVEVTCNDGAKVSCSGSGADCHYKDDSGFIWNERGYVQCDGDAKVSCN